MSKEIHILSRGVITNANHILLCKSKNLKQNFYFLPGVHIDHKEKAQEALLRELLEEVNIKGNIKRFLGMFECVFESADDNKVCHTHEYNLVFEVQAENVSCKESVNSLEDHIEFLWVNLLELKNIDLRPNAFISLIPKWLKIDIDQGFKSNINEINILDATIDDISSILPLMPQIGYPCSLEELTIRFKNFINSDGYGVAIASLDDKIVGLIAWSKSLHFLSDKTRIHIEALIIDENYRRQKIGKKLMSYLEEIAKIYYPVVIDLTSNHARAKDGTHAFYENLGYNNIGKTAKMYFRKELLTKNL